MIFIGRFYLEVQGKGRLSARAGLLFLLGVHEC